MPPTVPAGKTLHQRTKSSPALSTSLQVGAAKAATKKVLGEVSNNVKIAQPAKDDSAINGKKGQANISVQELVKPTAVRLNTRPGASKSVSSGATATTSTIASMVAKQQPVDAELAKPKHVVNKKSMIIKDLSAVEINKPVSAAPVHQILAAPPKKAQPVAQALKEEKENVPSLILPQHQDLRKIQSIPLRDEVAVRSTTSVKPSSVNEYSIVSHIAEEQQYVRLLEQQAQALELDQNSTVAAQSQCMIPSQQEQYYDVDEEEYYCEDGYTTARSLRFRGDNTTGGVTTVLAPKYTAKVQAEIAAAKLFVDTTRTAEDIEDEQWDTSMVQEYGDEIFDYMRSLEDRMRPNPHYMDNQNEIQWSMRSVLMDWLVQVHHRFTLLPETLFLSVNYIDRFLSCKIVSLGKLQLVGAVAIFIAAKYEEVNCPSVQEIVYMVDGGYSVDEVLKAERFMLTMLQFELGWPGPMSFLRRISKADDYDLETRTLAKYFLEITIMDERFVGCAPSFTAAGAHCLARLMLKKGDWVSLIILMPQGSC